MGRKSVREVAEPLKRREENCLAGRRGRDCHSSQPIADGALHFPSRRRCRRCRRRTAAVKSVRATAIIIIFLPFQQPQSRSRPSTPPLQTAPPSPPALPYPPLLTLIPPSRPQNQMRCNIVEQCRPITCKLGWCGRIYTSGRASSCLKDVVAIITQRGLVKYELFEHTGWGISSRTGVGLT